MGIVTGRRRVGGTKDWSIELSFTFEIEMKETEEAKGRGKEPEKSQVNLADLRHSLKQWTCGFDAEKCSEKTARDWMEWR